MLMTALALVVMFQVMVVVFNRVSILENEWNRLDGYCWNVRIKCIEYSRKNGRETVRSDGAGASLMQDRDGGMTFSVAGNRKECEGGMFSRLSSADRKRIVQGRLIRKSGEEDGRSTFSVYQPVHAIDGKVIGIICARDESGYYDSLMLSMIGNVLKADLAALVLALAAVLLYRRSAASCSGSSRCLKPVTKRTMKQNTLMQ